MHVDNEMLFDLARAVHADDLGKARDVLALMRACGGEHLAALLMKARTAVHPLPVVPDLREPFTLPVPGHGPGMTLSGERYWRAEK